MNEETVRPTRAILRNAATWGAAWAVAGGAIAGTLQLFSTRPGIDSLPERVGLAFLAGASFGVRFGVIGAVIGTAFALLVRFGYHGRRLADINPLLFALLGAVVGGVGVPLFLQAMNVLTGGGSIAWGLVTDDAGWAAVFGAAAAAGSILVARRALPGAPRLDELGRGDDLAGSPVARQRELSQR